MAIALLAIPAGARAAGEWKISEQTMTGLEAPEASIFGKASESFKLSVAWYASEIECATLASEAPTKIFKEGTSEAIVKLSSCKISGPPFVSETCKLVEPIELKVVGELLLHGTKTYELFKAPTGKESLGAIKFKEGTECPLPLSNELKGTLVGETEAGERVEQPLTFNATIESLFKGDTLSFGTHPATLKGKSLWSLAAGYKGLKWAAVGEKSEAEKLEEAELEEKKLKEDEEKKLDEEKLSKWRLLLNGAVVSELKLNLEHLVFGVKAENGLHVQCSGGTGAATFELIEAGKRATFSASSTLTGCVWVGSEKTCTINDGFEGGLGKVKISFLGEAVMPDASTYVVSAESPEFGTVYAEGALCTIPEEEVVSGKAHMLIENASTNTIAKLGKFLTLGMKLGSSNVTELTGEVHMLDQDNPSATTSIHL